MAASRAAEQQLAELGALAGVAPPKTKKPRLYNRKFFVDSVKLPPRANLNIPILPKDPVLGARCDSDGEDASSAPESSRPHSLENRRGASPDFLKVPRTKTGQMRTAPQEIGIHFDKVVRALPIFAECSADFVDAAMLSMQKRVFHSGKLVVRERGFEPRSMFLVLWGSCDVLVDGECVSTLKSGESVGEAMLLGISAKWPCSLRVSESCVLCELTHAALADTLTEFPEQEQFFDEMCSGLAGREKIVRNGHSPNVFRRCVALQRCSDDFLNELELRVDRRLYFPGEALFNEGDLGDTLFLLDRGAAATEMAGRMVSRIDVPHMRTVVVAGDQDRGLPGTFGGKSKPVNPYDAAGVVEAEIYGELSLLGISPRRTTTVRARRACDVRVLHRSSFLRVLQKYPKDELQVTRNFLETPHGAAFPSAKLGLPSVRSHRIYQHGSKDFADFLASHVEERIYAPGQQIISGESFTGLPNEHSTLYILSHGSVRTITPEEGEHGPGTIIEAADTTMAAARALTVCYVTVVHCSVIASALQVLPADRAVMLSHLTQDESPHVSEPFAESTASRILKERSIFSTSSQSFLSEFLRSCSCRVFLPGECIAEQGAVGASMFILSMGKANVLIEEAEEDDSRTRKLNYIGTLASGSVFGEHAILGMETKQTASIVASTLCFGWEVSKGKTLEILDRNSKERESFLRLVEDHLSQSIVPRILYHSLFTKLSRKFRMVLGAECERWMVFPGERIIREGTSGDKMYLVNLGSTSIEVNHQHVTQAQSGSYFGFSVMTGMQERYPATVIAETMCQVLIISRSLWERALNRIPDMQAVVTGMKAEQWSADQKRKETYMAYVQRRRGLKRITDALGAGAGDWQCLMTGEDLSHHSLLETAFRGWHGFSLRTADIRKSNDETRMRNAYWTDDWLEKRRARMEKTKPQRDLANLIDENVRERGPLKLLKKPRAKSPEPKKLLKDMDLKISPYTSCRFPRLDKYQLPRLGFGADASVDAADAVISATDAITSQFARMRSCSPCMNPPPKLLTPGMLVKPGQTLSTRVWRRRTPRSKVLPPMEGLARQAAGSRAASRTERPGDEWIRSGRSSHRSPQRSPLRSPRVSPRASPTPQRSPRTSPSPQRSPWASPTPQRSTAPSPAPSPSPAGSRGGSRASFAARHGGARRSPRGSPSPVPYRGRRDHGDSAAFSSEDDSEDDRYIEFAANTSRASVLMTTVTGAMTTSSLREWRDR